MEYLHNFTENISKDPTPVTFKKLCAKLLRNKLNLPPEILKLQFNDKREVDEFLRQTRNFHGSPVKSSYLVDDALFNQFVDTIDYDLEYPNLFIKTHLNIKNDKHIKILRICLHIIALDHLFRRYQSLGNVLNLQIETLIFWHYIGIEESIPNQQPHTIEDHIYKTALMRVKRKVYYSFIALHYNVTVFSKILNSAYLFLSNNPNYLKVLDRKRERLIREYEKYRNSYKKRVI